VSDSHDVVVIGAGVNGLVAAALLARAGLKPLVLERAPHIGGCAATGEIAPGYRCPTLAHRVAIDRRLVTDLDLMRHGLTPLEPRVHLYAPTGDGPGLALWDDPARASREIERFSLRDARRYPDFLVSLSGLAGVIRSLQDRLAPAVDRLAFGDVAGLLSSLWRFRALSDADGYRLLRYVTMPVWDMVAEWFESEPLRAAIAAAGILGSPVGPRSGGSAATLLWLAAQGGHPAVPGWAVRGGPGAAGDALGEAARAAGATIRLGAPVSRILARDERVTGVALASGEEIRADVVISNLDPRRTLLDLIDPVQLAPEFRQRLSNVRMRGTLMKVNYAVTSLPIVSGTGHLDPATRAETLSGAIRLCEGLDALERAFDAAKYGQLSETPWVELTIPSILDPGLAPEGRHVVSAYAAYGPIARKRAAGPEIDRDMVAARVTAAISRFVPRFDQSIVARQVMTPADLERDYGLTGGHPFHGELSLDQLFAARPLLGWARYRTPIAGLYLCGAGTHPGTGLTGRSGALAAGQVAADLRRGGTLTATRAPRA
jgi:phytoene dehydrogenase-like protein